MRKVNHDYLIESKDVGFIPEARLQEIAQTTPPYDYARSANYTVANVIAVAEMASTGDPRNLDQLTKLLTNADPLIRYWAVTGCIIVGRQSLPAKKQLVPLLNDPAITVRIAAAEALSGLGEKDKPLKTLMDALKSDNEMARVQALCVLDKLGPDASRAYPLIETLLKHPTNGVGITSGYDIRAAEHIMAQAKQ